MADLTIKFKGQPIVEMTESGTKTLKTAGKYCEDNISVEYAKPAGGGGGEMFSSSASGWIPEYQVGHAVSVLEVNMDMFETRAVEHIIKKYYYNGVLLPEIPADALAQYPYAWIRNNTRTGYYDLCLSSSLWYASDANTISTDSYNTTGIQWYQVTKSAPEEVWVFNQAWTSSGGFGNESDRHIMWSNHDIPNGSATATEIYFEGSEPVLAE